MSMKKYLMTAMAAVAMGVAFTSCSHNTDLYGGEEGSGKINGRTAQEQIELDKAVYKAAFEKTFGKVAPTVDWGFGSGSASSRAFTRAVGDYDDFRGHLQPTYPSWMTPIVFPSAPSNDNFKTTPSDLEESTSINAENGTYKIGANTTYVNLHGAGTIYVVGNCAPTSFYAASNSKIYIQNGATLTLTANDAGNTQPGDYYILSGGALNTSGELKVNNGLKIYNQGTITANKLSVNNGSVLYNQNSITVTTEISVENNVSIVVNDGTINAASSTLRGGGHIQNNEEWLISGNTVVNSNNATWVNNGYWRTNNYEYIGGSESVVNNCKLEVLNNFNMNIGQNSVNCFKIDSGGGVITRNFNGGTKIGNISGDGDAASGPYKIIMGHGSVFKVTETATLDAGNRGWGFFGPESGEYAVFQAKNVRRGRDGVQGMVTYGGNLYVSAETHFTNDDQYNPSIYVDSPFTLGNIYASGDDANFSTGKPNITISETPCNPGFGGNTESYTYRVIAEDLSATEGSDFDFNDVVFDVEPNETGDAAKIVLRAAGGIYRLTVADQEVHEAFGVDADNETGLYPMINTQPWVSDNKVTLIESFTGDFSSDEAIRNTIKDRIEIKVYKPNYEENGELKWAKLEAETGKPACKILVDKNFGVVQEREGIADEYTNFHKVVQGTWDTQTKGFWWKPNANN